MNGILLSWTISGENQTKTSEFHDSEESTKQESQDKVKSTTIARLESKNRPEKDKLTAESEENVTVMMCWENLKDSLGKEPHEEPEYEGKKSVEEMQKPKDEEEIVNSTLHTGN